MVGLRYESVFDGMKRSMIMGNLSFRYETENDCEKILFFIRELAAYEKMLDKVVATEELLKEWLFNEKKA